MLDFSNMPVSQIVSYVIGAIGIIIIVWNLIPKIFNFQKTTWDFIRGKVKKQEKKETLEKQIEINTDEIDALKENINGITTSLANAKKEMHKCRDDIDDMKALLTEYVMNSERRDNAVIADLNMLKQDYFQEKLERMRSEILEFCTRVRRGNESTFNGYQHIIDMAEDYHVMVKDQDIKNGVFDLEYEWLKHHFQELQETNGFLEMEIKEGAENSDDK